MVNNINKYKIKRLIISIIVMVLLIPINLIFVKLAFDQNAKFTTTMDMPIIDIVISIAIPVLGILSILIIFLTKDKLIKNEVNKDNNLNINPVVINQIISLANNDIDLNLMLLSLEAKGAIKVECREDGRINAIVPTTYTDQLDDIEQIFYQELFKDGNVDVKLLSKQLTKDSIESTNAFEQTKQQVIKTTNQYIENHRKSGIYVLFGIVIALVVALLAFKVFGLSTMFYIFSPTLVICVILVSFSNATIIKQPNVFNAIINRKHILEELDLSQSFDDKEMKQIIVDAKALDVNDKRLEDLYRFASKNSFNIFFQQHHLVYSSISNLNQYYVAQFAQAQNDKRDKAH